MVTNDSEKITAVIFWLGKGVVRDEVGEGVNVGEGGVSVPGTVR